MELGDIIELPKISEIERFDVDEIFISEEFNTAENKLVFYDKEQGECRLLYHKLDERLFASLVAQLSQSHDNKLYDFLKLVMEAVRLIKQGTKKGLLQAVWIEKYIKKHF